MCWDPPEVSRSFPQDWWSRVGDPFSDSCSSFASILDINITFGCAGLIPTLESWVDILICVDFWTGEDILMGLNVLIGIDILMGWIFWNAWMGDQHITRARGRNCWCNFQTVSDKKATIFPSIILDNRHCFFCNPVRRFNFLVNIWKLIWEFCQPTFAKSVFWSYHLCHMYLPCVSNLPLHLDVCGRGVLLHIVYFI